MRRDMTYHDHQIVEDQQAGDTLIDSISAKVRLYDSNVDQLTRKNRTNYRAGATRTVRSALQT